MESEVVSKNFIEQEIEKDLAEGVYDHVCTRFPPEPNGYLHIGHAKSILLNYGLAQKYQGTFHMRFDDTNPTKERMEFVDSIKEDIQWLGADWKEHLYFASDYFPQMYDCAVKLIQKGKAFVCDLSAEEIRSYRGTLTEPGKESPYRNRSVEENLQLFEEMRGGKYEDGEKVLRAKIDMASPNINMRDPVLYVWQECPIIIPGIPGVFTPCMISRIRLRTPSRELHIRSVLWSLKIIGLCMIGW